MATPTSISEKDLAALIQKLIRKRSGDTTPFRVSENLIEHRKNPFQPGEWFYVTLVASDPDMPMHRFSEMFGDVEQELEDQYHLDVLLVPGIFTGNSNP